MPYTLLKFCLLSLLGLCLCANLGQAQEVDAGIPEDKAQKADEIIQRYIQALGGHESLTQIHSLLIKGKSVGGEFSIKMPTQLVIKNPGKNKLEISVMNQKMVRATDGQISWGVNPFMGKGQPRQIPQFENDTHNNVFYTIGKNLIDYKERGFEAEYLGRISYKGHKAYHLRLKGELHEDEYYIDVKTFLLLMAKVDYSKSHFDNYKKVGNILFPHFIEGEEEDFRMEVEEVILNNQVADAEFEMPFAQFNNEENILLNHAIEEETFDISEEEHSPEDIIAQYQQQVGNQPTLGQARTYEMKGTLQLGSVSLPFAYFYKKNTGMLLQTTLMDEQATLAIRKNRAWESKPSEMGRETFRISLEEARENMNFFDFGQEIHDYQREGYAFEYLGQFNVKGRACHVLQCQQTDFGEEYLYFFEMETGLLRLRHDKITGEQTFFEAYQPFGAHLLPFRIENTNRSEDRPAEVWIESIQLNAKMDKQLFKYPKDFSPSF